MSWSHGLARQHVKLLPATKTVVDPPTEEAAGSGMSEWLRQSVGEISKRHAFAVAGCQQYLRRHHDHSSHFTLRLRDRGCA